MQGIIIATIVVAVTGLIIGVLLIAVGEKFAVEVDEREAAIRSCLPGNNCGACGFAGCHAYAEAIVNGEAESCNMCKPGMKMNKAEEIRKYLDSHPNDDGTINPIKVK